MKRFLSFILAITMAMTVFCCTSSADSDSNAINYRANVHQLFSGFTEEVYKTTSFGGNEIRSEAIITSPEEYRQYMSQFYDDETINQFAVNFGESVFDDYIVFLNTLYQGGGTSPCYSVTDVKVTDEGTTVYGKWEYPEIVADIISVLFVEVLIPKEEYKSDNYSVKWAENKESDDKPIAFDWDAKSVGFALQLRDKTSAVITTTSELEAYVSELGEYDTKEYLSKYDDKFFESNVILMNTVYQPTDNTPHLVVNNVQLTNENINVCCNWNYPTDFMPSISTFLFVAVSISKNDYNKDYNVRWFIEDNEPMDYYSIINNTEELRNYCEKFNANPENQDEYQEKFDDKFFEENVLLINAILYDKGSIVPFVHDTDYVVYNDIIYVDTVAIYSDYFPGLYENTDPVSEPFYRFLYAEVPKSSYNEQNVKWTISRNYTGYYNPDILKAEREWRYNANVITSVDELNKYLQRYDNENTKIRIKPQTNYNEEFFKENVLLINAVFYDYGDDLPASYGEYETVFSDDVFYINVPVFTFGMINNDQPLYDIFCVELSKDEYNGQSVEWLNSYAALQGNLSSEKGNKIYQIFSGYNKDMFDEEYPFEVITCEEDFKDYLSRLYDDETARKCLEIYDDEYFFNHYLIVGSFIQGAGIEPLLTIDSAYFVGESGNILFPRHYNIEAHWTKPDHELSDVLSALLVCIPIDGNYGNINFKIDTVGKYVETEDKPYRTYGDIDSDGKISMRDSLKIQRSCIGLEKLDEIAKRCADVNNDNRISNADALEIQRYCINIKSGDRIGFQISD